MSKKSKSGWEDSFFGGYNKLLFDYPPIKMNEDIDFDLKGENQANLGYYSSRVLMKLFLLKAKQYNMIKTLIINANEEDVTTLWFRKTDHKKYFVADIAGKEAALNTIINLDTEFSNLFIKYSDVILRSKIKVEVNKEHSIAAAIEKLEQIKEYKYEYISYHTSVSSGSLKENVRYTNAAKDTNPTLYTKEEEFYAGQLLRTLDIDFDPTYDKMSNLKSGKLDSSKIAESLAGSTNLYYTEQEKISTKPFKVCILCDESGSMDREVYNEDTGSYDGSFCTKQYSLVKTLYRAFSQILPPEEIYVYGHTGGVHPEVFIYNDKYNQEFDYRIDSMLERDKHQNYDGPVIESIYEKIKNNPDENMLFITISDGEPAGYDYGGKKAIDEMKRVIEKCKRDGFVTMGIGLADRTVTEIYNYNVVIKNFQKELVEKVSSLINNVVKTEFQS